MKVSVVGLGKIGLPLAVQYASKDCRVIGCDVDPEVVAAITEGKCSIAGEAGLTERLADMVDRGLLSATQNTTAAVAESDVVVIIVPVVINDDKAPDYSSLDAAAGSVGRGLRGGCLVIMESTVPVGTTRRRVAPILEKESGLRMGADFGLAFSPERVYSGRIFRDLATYPKIVGGVDEHSTDRAAAFYEQVLDAEVMRVESIETAEFVKLIETTYRDVNIALANQFAQYAAKYKIDVMQAVEAANSQPFSHIHRPGVGVGGHCVPVYPYFMMDGSQQPSLISMSRTINDGMAEYAVDLLKGELDGLANKNILVLGLAYRGDVKEAAFSSAWLLIEALEREGARVFVHDPLYSREELEDCGLKGVELESLPPLDAAILQSYHNAYQKLDFGCMGCRVVLDGRNVLDKERITKLGMKYIGIGR